MSLSVQVLTIFPRLVENALSEGMVRIARDRGTLDLKPVDIRDFSTDPHRTVDDTQYGGGAGMVMMVEPIVRAWRSIPEKDRGKTYVMSARGKKFDQRTAEEWSGARALTLVCGRYKGVDERVLDILGAEEISVGDFILPGGELAAAVMIESVVRLLHGVLGDEEAGIEDSHRDTILGYPVFTRPEEFEGHRVPEVLLSGHHGRIADWRRRQRLETTFRRRPDLLERAALSKEDRDFIDSLNGKPQGANA